MRRNPRPSRQQLAHRLYMRDYMRRRRRQQLGRFTWRTRSTSELSARRSIEHTTVRLGFCTRCGMRAHTDPCGICIQEVAR